MKFQRMRLTERFGEEFMQVIALWKVFAHGAKASHWHGPKLGAQFKAVATQQMAIIWLAKALADPAEAFVDGLHNAWRDQCEKTLLLAGLCFLFSSFQTVDFLNFGTHVSLEGEYHTFEQKRAFY